MQNDQKETQWDIKLCKTTKNYCNTSKRWCSRTKKDAKSTKWCKMTKKWCEMSKRDAKWPKTRQTTCKNWSKMTNNKCKTRVSTITVVRVEFSPPDSGGFWWIRRCGTGPASSSWCWWWIRRKKSLSPRLFQNLWSPLRSSWGAGKQFLLKNVSANRRHERNMRCFLFVILCVFEIFLFIYVVVLHHFVFLLCHFVVIAYLFEVILCLFNSCSVSLL